MSSMSIAVTKKIFKKRATEGGEEREVMGSDI